MATIPNSLRVNRFADVIKAKFLWRTECSVHVVLSIGSLNAMSHSSAMNRSGLKWCFTYHTAILSWGQTFSKVQSVWIHLPSICFGILVRLWAGNLIIIPCFVKRVILPSVGVWTHLAKRDQRKGSVSKIHSHTSLGDSKSHTQCVLSNIAPIRIWRETTNIRVALG